MFIADSHSSGVKSVRGYAGGSWLRARLRRLAAATALGVALTAVIGAPGALAQGQEHSRFHDIFTEVDPDFCGTGQEIDIAFDIKGNEWSAPHEGDFKATMVGTVTYTNPLTGDVVIQHFANAFWGVEGGEITFKGLPELFKTLHGGVLTRDAGYIVFDADGEILINKGPHPQAESDFELFCEILPEALGL